MDIASDNDEEESLSAASGAGSSSSSTFVSSSVSGSLVGAREGRCGGRIMPPARRVGNCEEVKSRSSGAENGASWMTVKPSERSMISDRIYKGSKKRNGILLRYDAYLFSHPHLARLPFGHSHKTGL